MILNTIKPNIETSDSLEAKFFSVGDIGMIFEVLRNKMYSDPIRAIAREYCTNSLDAHREVGKYDEPIEITLPTTFDPFLRIKDWGPGISPDRMENVFIKYGASTKRDNNIQIGSFGLGCKVFFSYGDAFNIETIFNNVKYNYVCYIDETKVGKLSLMEQTPTEDGNGTTIIIPVNGKDFNKFADDIEFVTRHWKVKPIIKGRKISYTEIVPTLSGNKYVITKSDSYNTIRDIKVIIDGIRILLTHQN